MKTSIVDNHRAGYTVALLRGMGPERVRSELELTESGAVLPLPHRLAWAQEFNGIDSWFLAVRDGTGRCRGGLAIEATKSRALPGHLLLRVRRCSPMKAEGALRSAFAALAKLVRGNPRILRVNVELFSPDAAFRADAGSSLAELGFRPAPDLRSYAKTIAVDLTPDEETIFARLHKKTRRDIRATGRHSLEVRPITDLAFIARIEAMQRATLERTNGTFVRKEWATIIEFCRKYPTMARLVGQFRTDANGPESLLAYAWSLHHGDHAEYNLAASMREENIKVPLNYTLIWDLICWSKQNGASWFDMGGVTSGHLGDADDPLGGISDFKRYFSKTIVEVGDEWEWEPRPMRARLARAIGAVGKWISRTRGAHAEPR